MRRRLAWVLAALVVAGGIAGGWWWTSTEAERDADARAVLTSYVDGWRARDLTRVPFAEPGAAADFAAATRALRPAPLTVEASALRREGSSASADLTVTWTLPGGVPWRYTTPVRLVERGDGWVVTGPAAGSPWHPDLPAGETLGLERALAERGDLLGRDGTALPVQATVGQPLLGTVGELSAAQVEASQGRLAAGDRGGVGGLQEQYDETLGGTSGEAVVTSAGRTLFSKASAEGEDVRTTLDARVQKAADAALVGVPGAIPAALVAVDVPTGSVLAVANRPGSGTDRALAGRYPAGAALSIASTYALLTGGVVTPSTPVACPGAVTVDGTTVRNDAGTAPVKGRVPFAEAFARSCLTTTASLAQRLGGTDLPVAASSLGIAAGWAEALGVAGAVEGAVPEADGAGAATAAGRGGVEVSPLSLAVMAGSIGRGTYLPPSLVTTTEGGPRPVALDGRAVGQLRSMLADVVTSGSATALRNTPGGPVRGTPGTAEGDAGKRLTWFAGYQGDIAVAVLVEGGTTGGRTAAPVAKRFLTTLAAG